MLSETIRCVECGYDLRGSCASDRCPECGTDTAISYDRLRRWKYRLRRRPWRWCLAAATSVAIVVTALSGYLRLEETWACVKCGKVETRHIHGYWIPATDVRILQIAGAIEPAWVPTTLPNLLDPERTCQHTWVLDSCSFRSSRGGRIGGGPLKTHPGSIIDADDFDEFISANPHVVHTLPAKLREAIRTRTFAVEDFLIAEYCQWLRRTKGIECFFDTQ